MPPKNENKNETTREPVTLTGVALLAAIAGAEAGYLMLTQAEGAGIVSEGLAVVDMSITEGTGESQTAAVKLTEAGQAKLAEGQASPNTGYEIEEGVPLPAGAKRRGRETAYPFDKLDIGQSFHVAPKTKDGKLETPAEVVTRLSSSTSAARSGYLEDIPGETETYTKTTYQKDANGKFVKDSGGKRVVANKETLSRNKQRLTRDFKVAEVGADDPKGAGARCWRIAL